MKFLTTIEMNKKIKRTLAIVLTSSICLPSTLAFAEETPITNVDSTETTTEEVISLDEVLTDDAGSEAAETPALLPGDFFYFAKLAIEKIQLLLTMDEVEEAKLLADFASERLLEAQTLFEEGKQAEATDALAQALETLAQAQDASAPITEEAETEDTKPEEPAATEGATEEATEEVTEEVTEETVTEIEEDTDIVELDQQMSQNIIALTLAMEKVKNPTAKAALQKNIEKSYAKLAKKLEKLERKAQKQIATETEDVVEPNQPETTSAPTTDTTSVETTEPVVVVEPTEVESGQVETTDEPVATQQTVVVAPGSPTNLKEQKQIAKQEKKQEKAAEKAQQKQDKAEAKGNKNK